MVRGETVPAAAEIVNLKRTLGIALARMYTGTFRSHFMIVLLGSFGYLNYKLRAPLWHLINEWDIEMMSFEKSTWGKNVVQTFRTYLNKQNVAGQG